MSSLWHAEEALSEVTTITITVPLTTILVTMILFPATLLVEGGGGKRRLKQSSSGWPQIQHTYYVAQVGLEIQQFFYLSFQSVGITHMSYYTPALPFPSPTKGREWRLAHICNFPLSGGTLQFETGSGYIVRICFRVQQNTKQLTKCIQATDQ